MQRAIILAAGECVEAMDLHLPAGVATGMAAVLPLQASAAPQEMPPTAMRSDNLRDLERDHILETLAAVGGSRKLAGERLGMSERTLRHKLKQYRDAGLFDG